MASLHHCYSPQDSNQNSLARTQQTMDKSASPPDIPSCSTLDTIRKTVADSEHANSDGLMGSPQHRSSMDELRDQNSDVAAGKHVSVSVDQNNKEKEKAADDKITEKVFPGNADRINLREDVDGLMDRQISDFCEAIEEMVEENSEQKSFTSVISSPLLPGYELPEYVLTKPLDGYLRFDKEAFLKDCEHKKTLELQATDEMIESHQTFTDMIRNERRWQKERSQACSVIAECKAYLNSFNPPQLEGENLKVDDTAGLGDRQGQENVLDNARGDEDLVGFYDEDVLGIEPNDLIGLDFSESFTTKAGSEDDGRQGISERGQAALDEIDREMERMRRNELRSVTQAMEAGETMTHFIINDMKRAKELKECQDNIKSLVESLDKLLPKA